MNQKETTDECEDCYMGYQTENIEFVLVPDEIVVLVVLDHEGLDQGEAAAQRGDVDDDLDDCYF